MEMYVLQVTTNRESRVKSRLEKMGFSVFMPSEEITVRSNGKWKSYIKPIFPQYVFIECEMNPENYRRIKSVPKVLRFLGAETPEPLPPDEQEYIMILNNDGKIVRASEIEVADDGNKKVVSGMLKKYENKIIFVNLRQRRAGIELELCGKKHFLTLPVIEKESNV